MPDAVAPAAQAVEVALQELSERCALYAQPYTSGEIDSDINAHLEQDSIRNASSRLGDIRQSLTEHASSLNSTLAPALPILGCDAPDESQADGALGDTISVADQLDARVTEHETWHAGDCSDSFSATLTSLSSALSRLASYGGGGGYVSGDFPKNSQDLYQAEQASIAYVQAHGEDAGAALQEMNQRQQDEIEREQRAEAQDRMLEGVAGTIGAGLAIVAGVGLIVASGGIATPLVAGAAWALGAGAVGFGASDAVEGVSDLVLGGLGITTDDMSSLNPIRDWVAEPIGGVFGYDEGASDAVYHGVSQTFEQGAQIAEPFAKVAAPLATVGFSYTSLTYEETEGAVAVTYVHAEGTVELRDTTSTILAAGTKAVVKDKAIGYGTNVVTNALISDDTQAEAASEGVEALREVVHEVAEHVR